MSFYVMIFAIEQDVPRLVKAGFGAYKFENLRL